MIKADYFGNEIMAVAVIKAVDFNPRRKKEDEYKRKKRAKDMLDKEKQDKSNFELPENSTISYYV